MVHFSLSDFCDLILCTKYFRSCILWPYKILSGPAITYKLLRLTYRPMYTLIESLLQLVSVPGDGAEGSALSAFHSNGNMLAQNSNFDQTNCVSWYL